MKSPTIRKVRNRGWTPIRYRMQTSGMDEVRHGWEIERDQKSITVQLVGDDRRRRLPLSEGRFISEVRQVRPGSVKRFHVHAALNSPEWDDDLALANFTITLDALDAADAQERVWALFPDHSIDITEIELA